jgi:hypothetical protein
MGFWIKGNILKKLLPLILWFLVAWIFVTALFFTAYYLKLEGDVSSDLALRGLDNPLKLWLHGYLGQFFHFTVMGFLSWLMIPVYIYVFLNGNKVGRPVQGVLLFLALFGVLIAVKGFFNHRYIITLLPAYTVIVFHFVGNFLSRKTSIINPYQLLFSFAVFTSITVLTVSFVSNRTDSDWNAIKMKYYKWISARDHKKKIVKKSATPFATINLLNDTTIPTSVFVNELPIFYYYTNLKGIYYNPLYDFYYSAHGKVKLLEDRSDNEVVAYLADSLNCRFVFTSKSKNSFSPRFADILQSRFDTLAKDSYYLLFVVKDD